MTDHSDDQRGRWVFRNQRWNYVASVDEPPILATPHIELAHIAGLVDSRSFIRPIGDIARLSGVPVTVYLTDPQTQDNQSADSLREPLTLHSQWSQLVAAECPQLQQTLERQTREFAHQILTQKIPLDGDSVLGTKTLRGEPVAVFASNRSLFYAVFVSVVATTESTNDFKRILESTSVPADKIRQIADLLPGEEAVRRHVRLASMTASSFADRLQHTHDHRFELNVERTKSRQYLVRAESLEKQILRERAGSASPSTDGLEARVFEVLLDSPLIGITVEDDKHNVRYVNPYMRRTYGDVVGQKCHRAFRHSLAPCPECPIDQIWGQGAESHHYFSSTPKGDVQFEIFALPLIGPKGERLVIEVGLNVTRVSAELVEIKNQFAAMKQRNRQLAELVRGLTVSALDMSGEVGLGSKRVRQLSRLLAQDTPLSQPDLLRWVEQLHSTLNDVDNLLEKVKTTALAIGSSEAPAAVDLELLCREQVAIAQEKFGIPEDRVSVGTMPSVEADAGALRHLIAALLDNIISSTTDGPIRQIQMRYGRSRAIDSSEKGDAFHLLVLSHTFRDDSEMAWEGEGPPTLSQRVHLLSLYVGGTTWIEQNEATRNVYQSFPMQPPSSLHHGDPAEPDTDSQ